MYVDSKTTFTFVDVSEEELLLIRLALAAYLVIPTHSQQTRDEIGAIKQRVEAAE